MNEDRPLRIVYFGTPAFAVPALQRLLDSRHTVAAVVTQPDRARDRGQRIVEGPVKALAKTRGVSVLQPEKIKDSTFHEAVRGLRPDLAVVAAYGRILPDELLAVPRLGFINIHASLLPAYRGASPIQHAVISGERETGVSIMRVVRELDAGPVLAARQCPIGPDDTSEDVERALARIGADLLLDVVDELARGGVPERPQEGARATYAAKLTKADGLLDWSQPAARLHNRVRGLHPWPHAYSFLRGQRYVILRTAVIDDWAGRQPGEAPGEVLEARGDTLIVGTGSGALRVIEIQPEGKRPMTAREFLAGHRVEPGDRFGDR